MRALSLAPALLLALAACSVETNSLKPKTDAECAAQSPTSKACGYKCVSMTDTKTGCGVPGSCQPCPSGGPGWETFCGPALECVTRGPCGANAAHCTQYGTVCDDLTTSPSHCGACGHPCDTTCSGGVCGATMAGSAAGSMDLASDGYSWFLLLNGAPAAGLASVLKDGLAHASWVGSARRLEVDGYGFVAWDPTLGSTAWVADWTGTPVRALFTAAATPVSAALDPDYAYFVETGGASGSGESPSDLVWRSRAAGTGSSYQLPGAPALWAVAIVQPGSTTSDALLATTAGSLQWVNWNGTASGTYATGVDVPVRMVGFQGYVGIPGVLKTYAFWLGASGALYRMDIPSGAVETLVPPSAASPNYLDLYADADGVYWSDENPGSTPFVAEWRAAHDDLVLLAMGTASDAPARVTAASGRVYWLTASSGSVYSVPR